MTLDRLNATRYRRGRIGHYESFYQRANHPDRPLAFWLRYTLFSPRGRPDAAVGELWAVFFDGETGEHVSTREEYPIADCDFATDRFAVRIADRTLGPGALRGTCGTIAWNLTYDGDERPLLLLPQRLYRGSLPKAKSLVGVPLARYRGTLTVGGRIIEVDDWLGSQNHNWGSRHTDRYAFGQVAGFDGAPGSFLEVATAQARIGPVLTPRLTFLVLRHEGREYAHTSLRQAVRAGAAYDDSHWEFATASRDAVIRGWIAAAPEDFVRLRYANPPGGAKLCLNTKLAGCRLTVTDRTTGAVVTLTARWRALFEVLTDLG
jgi:hypothetical protein